jgi:hypothetical protein
MFGREHGDCHVGPRLHHLAGRGELADDNRLGWHRHPAVVRCAADEVQVGQSAQCLLRISAS